MGKQILLIQGHPDKEQPHLCHALQEAYAAGARQGGHMLECIEVAALEFPLLRSRRDWQNGETPGTLHAAQEAILWAEHLVFFFPLWLGEMPALLKGFLEQVARPGFAFHEDAAARFPRKALTGRSARVIVTMGMPAPVYRWYYGAHGVKNLRRNILRFTGIDPVRETLIGGVGNMKPATAQAWLGRMEKSGRQAV